MSLYPPAPPHRLGWLATGPAGIRQTLKLMRELTLQSRKDPSIKTLADSIVRTAVSGNFGAQNAAVFHWVKRNIRYVRDIRDVETVSTPQRTLTSRTGDCDDMAVLIASLLESVGNKTRFVALGFNGDFEHVIAQVRMGPHWVSMDPTVAYAFPGWHPPNETRRMVVHV